MLAVAAIYWPSATVLNAFWTDSVNTTYTHGYLVLLTSLWLILRDRERLAAAPIKPAPRALLLVLAASLVWLWVWRAAIQDAHLLVLPLLVFAAVLATLGRRLARALLFPIGFLYFAIPAWNELNTPLQFVSARANGALMWLTGVPGYMQGDFIQLPAGTLRIAGGCSGLHSMIIGLALAALYGELQRDSLRRRLAWLAIMGAFAAVCNWARIYIITLTAYTSDMKSPLVSHHKWLGWVLFCVIFFCFLWIAGRVAARWDAAGPQRIAAEAPHRVSEISRVRLTGVIATIAALAALPAVSYGMDAMRSGQRSTVAIEWARAPAGWRGPLAEIWGEWDPVYQHASALGQRRYVDSAGQTVEVFTVVYRTQGQNGKLLGYWNSLLGSGERLRAVSKRTTESPAGRWRQTMAVDPAGTRSLIWSRYRVGDRQFVNPRVSQLWYGIAALGSRPVSSLTALRAVCTPDCTAARRRLGVAARELEPTVRLSVPGPAGAAP